MNCNFVFTRTTSEQLPDLRRVCVVLVQRNANADGIPRSPKDQTQLRAVLPPTRLLGCCIDDRIMDTCAAARRLDLAQRSECDGELSGLFTEQLEERVDLRVFPSGAGR